MAGHTPGPFRVGKGEYVQDWWVGGGGHAIADLTGPYIDREANAYLFAAAPNLLEALEALVGVGECYSAEHDGRMYDICFCCGAEISEDKPHKPDCEWIAARAAISKARGQV